MPYIKNRGCTYCMQLFIFFSCAFFAITWYNSDTHNIRTLTLYKHTYGNSTPMSIFEE